MLSGSTGKEVFEYRSLTRALSIFILLAGALFFGLFMPESVENVFNSIVAILLGGTP